VSKLFGAIRQTAFVVPDIYEAMRYWTEVLQVGPFFLLPNLEPKGATFRGQPTDFHISLAFANSGAMQIELVQQHNDAPSLFTEFVASGRTGVQHIAFWTETFDSDIEAYQRAGYEVVQTAGMSGADNRNAFLEKRGVANELAIEISEIRGSKGRFFKLIEASSIDWDGSNPVRTAP
jgi:hypothetical protein